MRYPVKWFDSKAMGGIPLLATGSAVGVPSQFNNMLRTLLIEGFNAQVAATAFYNIESERVRLTLSSGHGFVQFQIITVSGVNQAEYNGDQRVSAIGDNWIEYKPETVPVDLEGTGLEIGVKASPIGGWQLVAEDPVTHEICIRSTAPDASPHWIIIRNDGYIQKPGTTGNNGNFAIITVCEEFTDFSTFESAFSVYWPASHRYAAVSQDDYCLIGDSKTLYFDIRYTVYNKRVTFVLGDIETARPGDRGHFIANGINGLGNSNTTRWSSTSSDNSGNDFPSLNTAGYYRTMARAHHQLPGSTSWKMRGISDGALGILFSYPNPQTNGFHVATGKIIVEESLGIRGFMRGLLQPLHTNAVYDGKVIDTLPDLDGIPVLFRLSGASPTQNNATYYLIAFRLDRWTEEVG